MRFAANVFGAFASTSPVRRRVNLDDFRSSRWRLPAREIFSSHRYAFSSLAFTYLLLI
jgi:hypothetical protein